MTATATKWIETKDGIWPMLIRDVLGGQIYVTQYARADWRWTFFNGRSGVTKNAAGRCSNKASAKRAAVAASVQS